jgi:hypothetical protein
VKAIATLILLLLAAAPLRAGAQTPRDEAFVRGDDLVGFAVRGQWVISSDAAMSIQRISQRAARHGGSLTATVAPAVDLFVIENLSLGASVGVQHARAGAARSTRVSTGPRLGYNVEISHLLSFWPRIGLSYSYSATRDREARVHNHALGINVFAPILMHPVAQFFVGFGPFVDVDLHGRARAVLWGGRITLGGWL